MSYIKCARIAGVLGNNVNTDVIYPARYLVLFAPDEVKRHLFEDIDPGLAPKLAGGGILAGENFGCGSAREQGLTALKYAGTEVLFQGLLSQRHQQCGSPFHCRLSGASGRAGRGG